MFCFGLQSIARFIKTNSPYFITHSLEAEVKFSWNFVEKIKMLFTGLGRFVLGETLPSVWVPPEAVGRGRYSRPRAQFLPIRTSQPVNNICVLELIRFCILNTFRVYNLLHLRLTFFYICGYCYIYSWLLHWWVIVCGQLKHLWL